MTAGTFTGMGAKRAGEERVLAHPAVADLLAGGPPPPLGVTAFLEARSFPTVEPGRALFAWRGEADHVHLVRWISAGIDRAPFVRLVGTDLWLLVIDVEDGGRFEYKIALGRGDREEWVVDPLNPETARDPFGENSVCRTHGYLRPAWTEPRGAPQGRIEALAVDSAVFDERREENVYLPHGHRRDGRYPLLVIHDGEDFVTYANLSVALDNLIAAGDIPPLLAALVQTRDRMAEYPRGRRHARYLVREVLPAIGDRYALSDAPRDRVLLGASLGAVASLATAYRFPGVFGGLVLLSGSFILDERKLRHRPHPVFEQVARLVKALRRAPRLPDTRVFIATGELEGLAQENRALADVLRGHGMDVAFRSAWDGHHWHNWRDQLRDGLTWVFSRKPRP